MSPLSEASPSPCATCPRILELQHSIQRTEGRKDLVTTVVTSGAYDAMTERVSELLQQIPPELLGNETTNEEQEPLSVSSRRMAAAALDQFDDEIDTKHQAIEALKDSCDSPLTMRAQKAGTVYLATICTAKIVRSTSGGSEPARVIRKSSEQ